MRKWFDVKDGAKFLGITPRELYTLIKFNEFELRSDMTRVLNTRLISISGLKKLIKMK